MSYGQYRNSGIYLLGNYAQALEKYETTKPIRGREIECRPLGSRDKTHFSIAKDKTTGDILCYEYGYTSEKTKASIIFRPNGEVHLCPYWTSISAAGFIYDVLGVYAKIFDGDVIVSLRMGDYRVNKKGITIKRNEEGKYEVVNHVPHVVHHIKRKETNIVRSKYSEFRDFLSGFIKLRGSARVTTEELEEIFGFTDKEVPYGDVNSTYTSRTVNRPSMVFSKPEDMQNLFNLIASDDPADRFKAAVMICSEFYAWRASEKLSLTTLDKCILAHHKTEVFEYKEVSAGQVVKDRYSWAF